MLHLAILFLAFVAVFIVGAQLALLWIQFIGSIIPEGENILLAHTARCAVIVPAHNERGNIAATVTAIRSQLNPSDRLFVVADNCTDETAALASEAGAETIIRTNNVDRGKGFALDFGITHIAAQFAPAVVVVVDADCIVAPGCISRLVNLVESTGRPAQGKYLIHAAGSHGATRVSEFTFKVKNYVRPFGGSRFGFPSLLYGTGMAFPWKLIRGSILANGHLTEDLKLAADLSLLGFPPVYCAQAACDSTFPETDKALSNQRKRWEHGYFSTMVSYTPRLFAKALTTGNWKILAVALDLSIPPLALLLMITAFMSGSAAIALILGKTATPALMAVLYFPILASLILLLWWVHGRDIISGHDFVSVVRHIFVRLSMLWSFLTRRQRHWVRAERREDKRPDL